MLVYKFGGTSVQDPHALAQAVAIIEQHNRERGALVVVSSAASGITDELSSLALDAVNDHTDVPVRVDAIRHRHASLATSTIVDDKNLDAAVKKINHLCDNLLHYLASITTLNECTDQSSAEVLAHGELLSTTVLCYALRSRGHSSIWHDARSLLRTSGEFLNASVDLDITQKACEELVALERDSIHVTQGFISSDSQGRTMVLGRGGSDASAAILGAALGAEEIVIWTDVSGVFSGDPRHIAAARPVPSLSFGEIRDLSLYGAKVLHPDAILPAIKKAIPVLVKNTFRPTDAGTTITTDTVAHGRLHAVTSLRNCMQITGTSRTVQQCIRSGNILRNVVLDTSTDEHGTCIVHSPEQQSRTDVEVAVAGSSAVVRDVALVVITGPAASTTQTVERITRSMADIPMLGLVVGLSKWTTFVVVGKEDAQQTVEQLHKLVLEN